MEALKKLKRVQKRNLVRLKATIELLSGQRQLDFERLSKLEAILTEYRTVKAKYDEIVDQILASGDELDPLHIQMENELMRESDEVSDVVFSTEAKIRNFKRVISADENRQSLVNVELMNRSVTGAGGNQLRLKEITVPKFCGDITAFKSFRQLFENLVHNNEELTNIQKLFYLKDSLVGDAKLHVRDFDLEERSYPEAWSYVVARYDNPRSVLRNMFRKFVNVKRIKSESEIRGLIDEADMFIRGLKSAGEKVNETFSRFICFWVGNLLDNDTARDWENSVVSRSYPMYEELQKFLQSRAFNIEDRVFNPKPTSSKPEKKKLLTATVSTEPSSGAPASPLTNRPPPKFPCVCCKAHHFLIDCVSFKSMSPVNRYEVIRANNLCCNCFGSNHTTKACLKPPRCNQCAKSHHTLLHFGNPPSSVSESAKPSNTPPVSTSTFPASTPSPNAAQSGVTSSVNTSICSLATEPIAVLPSALVRFRCGDVTGLIRVLLDTGAQRSLINQAFVSQHHLPFSISKSLQNIAGVNNVKTNCNRFVNIELISRFKCFSLNVNATVYPTSLPYTINNLSISKYSNRLREFALADPLFYEPVVNIPTIDLLLGIDAYDKVVTGEQVWIDSMCLRSTYFGWTISSIVANEEVDCIADSYCGLVTTDSELDQQLTRFWKIEEACPMNLISTEEKSCDDHFAKNFLRQPNGQFVVRLPFKSNPSAITNNKFRALGYLKKMERSLDQPTREAYINFMREYEALGHMTRMPSNDSVDRYFIPHRIVLRPSSTTTKLRVVFHASAKSTSGSSLNDILMKGPVLQPELFDQLMVFRTYPIAFTADIAKMYRCVLVHDDDRRFQSILWRESPDEPFLVYQLNTVTYGTKPASFLATKCLEVLGNECTDNVLAKQAIQRSFYMDDLLCGADTLEAAIKLRADIHRILKAAGFLLRKYQSNSSKLLSTIDPDLIESDLTVAIGGEEALSILGLSWSPSTDQLRVKTSLEPAIDAHLITKRMISSEIAKVFDPLGIVSPVTIRGKLFLQRLWRLQIGWDDVVDPTFANEFLSYIADLNDLAYCNIPRYIGNRTDSILIGFCDASATAYSAVLYIRSKVDDTFQIRLLGSKTRVAPLKELTIPQLELQAAVMLSDVMERVCHALSLDTSSVHLYTDAKVILSWISKPSKDWKTFVRNRVSKISAKYPIDYWSYVPSKSNPADLATRGVATSQLLSSAIWFNGPSFLSEEELIREEIEFQGSADEWRSSVKSVHAVTETYDHFIQLIESFSAYYRLLRVFSTVVKYFHCWKSKKFPDNFYLSANDLEYGLTALLRIVQRSYFNNDFHRLKANRSVQRRSSLFVHNVFLDSNGLIRSRTRLQNALVAVDRKCPIVIPGKCHLSVLLIRHIHEKFFHAGRGFVISHLSAKYHFLGGIQTAVRKLIRSCVVCIRHLQKAKQQKMANLPASRVIPTRPFSVVGVDFTGAFKIKCTKHRSHKLLKAYAAIFVCFSTRAVHIEAVSSLSTEDFLNAFHRFVSRRGVPSIVYSDNGTNFVGADRYLNLKDSSALTDFAVREGIHWRFNLAGTPHRGGIWESAVKSAKKIIPLATKEQVMTFESLTTLLARIECILNSRPLAYRTSTNPEFEVLTPGHFLVGSNLSVLPEPTESPNVKLTEHYTAHQQRLNSFWKHWSRDYLNSLKTRTKWCSSVPNLKVGQVVIVKNELHRAGEWKLGKIVQCFPDEDNIVRTVKVLFDNQIKSIASNLLFPLPDSSEAEAPAPASGSCSV